MPSVATPEITSPVQALERLSAGEPVQGTRVAGLLDPAPLVVSRWLCGEDLCGVYQPIILRHCVLDGLDLKGRTFYEMVELVGCRVVAARFRQAYFYSSLLIEGCIFEGDFEGRDIQSEERMLIHNTIFFGYADFGGISLRDKLDLHNVSFPGGTNLLHVLAHGSRERIGREILINDCRFRAADVPAGLETAQLGITPLFESDLRGAKG
jgi:uncharacterized protein YjbI with pentapeptide repeats